ncbi:acyl-CoA thioesterase/bile acid-CoA:amino acid N-acyltransferase family protein [Flindersiella endophytica]
MGLRVGICGAAVASAVMLCAGSAACTGQQADVVIHLPERMVLVDENVPISVTGLKAGGTVVLRANDSSVNKRAFASWARFRADGQGTVDVRRDAPLAGTYTGVAATGLLWSMRPNGQHEWLDIPAFAGQRVTVTADVDGRRVASASFVRSLRGPGVRQVSLRVRQDGFHGEFLIPAGISSGKPAVMVLGGSEGGTSGELMGNLLASHGYRALAVGYFDEPGLPDELSNIPLEYFAKALGWLAKQPGVDPERIVVIGASRGSEAALLAAAHFPELVHGVVGLVPSNVVVSGTDYGPSWTRDGKPLPHDGFGPLAVSPAYEIPVERIGGPVLLVCGRVDHIWQSCAMADAIAERRRAQDPPADTSVLAYPKAGHGVAFMIPNLASSDPRLDGDDPSANQHAITNAWPKLLHYLARQT